MRESELKASFFHLQSIFNFILTFSNISGTVGNSDKPL